MKENKFELDTELLCAYLFGGITDDEGTLKEPLDIFDYESPDALADALRDRDQIRSQIENAVGAAEHFIYYDDDYQIALYTIPNEQIELLTDIFFDLVSDTTAEHTYIELNDLEGRSDLINQTDDIDIVHQMKNENDEDDLINNGRLADIAA